MKAVIVNTFGAVEGLKIVDLPDPVPGPGEVLVEVVAAGVNYPDLLVAEGRYQNRPPHFHSYPVRKRPDGYWRWGPCLCTTRPRTGRLCDRWR